MHCSSATALLWSGYEQFRVAERTFFSHRTLSERQALHAPHSSRTTGWRLEGPRRNPRNGALDQPPSDHGLVDAERLLGTSHPSRANAARRQPLTHPDGRPARGRRARSVAAPTAAQFPRHGAPTEPSDRATPAGAASPTVRPTTLRKRGRAFLRS